MLIVYGIMPVLFVYLPFNAIMQYQSLSNLCLTIEEFYSLSLKCGHTMDYFYQFHYSLGLSNHSEENKPTRHFPYRQSSPLWPLCSFQVPQVSRTATEVLPKAKYKIDLKDHWKYGGWKKTNEDFMFWWRTVVVADKWLPLGREFHNLSNMTEKVLVGTCNYV